MKKLIALIVLAGTLIAGAIGCGPSPTSSKTGGTSTGMPKTGGTGS